jgi:hypothetical protein
VGPDFSNLDLPAGEEPEKELPMIIVLAKVLAVDRQSDHYRMVSRIGLPKYRGSIESVTLDKKMSTGDLFRMIGAAIWRLNALLAICLCVGIGAAEKTLGQDQLTGHWETLPYLMPINPIRLGLMHTGKVLVVAGSENDADEHSEGSSKAAIWDPGTHTHHNGTTRQTGCKNRYSVGECYR